MTHEEIIEGNKLIAEFMGHYFIDAPKQYHSSWDWLMPVVEKIEDLSTTYNCGYAVNMNNWEVEIIELYSNKIISSCSASEGRSKIGSTWVAVVQFIKWYNTQKYGK